jgi:hypothetical protein
VSTLRLCARVVWVATLALLLAGCTVSFVAEYDKATEDRLLGTYERISRFYDDLAETAPAQRAYDEFTRQYSDVATDLRVLLLHQRARATNSESEQIVAKILENWERTREHHRRFSADAEHRANPYPDSLIALDRQQFEDQFRTAVVAERAKK